jgi:2-polyprenyl-6-methoxyphenol hydroxylase-like FAD-dependent oxidoreductase
VRELHAVIGTTDIIIADFTHLPVHHKFLVLMPQWDFLNFLLEKARRLPGFQLKMNTEVTDLIREDGKVIGVRAKTPEGELEVCGDLVIGADGRSSVVRERAGLEVIDLGAPMDVLWMRVSRRPDDPAQSLGRANAGGLLILLDRGDYWQCGMVIGKGAFEDIKQKGLTAFHERIIGFAPFLQDRVSELDDWGKIKLLTVKVDRLKRWHCPGLLCIGDSAHAMSPIGGVGINLAIQDAVATANLLAEPLRTHALNENHLVAVQQRRQQPARITQNLQLLIQNKVIEPLLNRTDPVTVPTGLKLLQRLPLLRRIPARLIGVGFRPEHVKAQPMR